MSFIQWTPTTKHYVDPTCSHGRPIWQCEMHGAGTFTDFPAFTTVTTKKVVEKPETGWLTRRARRSNRGTP